MPEFEKYPGENPEEAMKRINQNIEESGLPASNAMERSEIGDSTDFYNIGGIVKPIYKKGGKV